MIKEIAHRKTRTRAGNARLINELNKVKVTNLVSANDGISRSRISPSGAASPPGERSPS